MKRTPRDRATLQREQERDATRLLVHQTHHGETRQDRLRALTLMQWLHAAGRLSRTPS